MENIHQSGGLSGGMMLSSVFKFEILETALNRHAKRPSKLSYSIRDISQGWETGWQMKYFGERTCIRVAAQHDECKRAEKFFNRFFLWFEVR